MKPARKWQLLAVAACVLAIGIPYWVIPYSRLSLPTSLLTPALSVVALAALLLCGGRVASLWRATWVAAVSVPLTVAIRVIVDTMKDPTSHNLWPIEIVIAAIAGFACALPGALLGTVLAMALGIPRRDAKS